MNEINSQRRGAAARQELVLGYRTVCPSKSLDPVNSAFQYDRLVPALRHRRLASELFNSDWCRLCADWLQQIYQTPNSLEPAVSINTSRSALMTTHHVLVS